MSDNFDSQTPVQSSSQTLDQNTADMFAAPAQEMVAGGILRRIAARIVDSMIVSIVSLPVTLMLGFNSTLTNLTPGGTENPLANLGALFAMQSASMVVSTVITLMYYGWFNAKKGGTPGRLVMGLKIVNAQNGTHLSYGTTILRETVGMWAVQLGCIFLFLPIWFAVARKDRKTWADMICGSQVLYDKNS